ncbi:MAG: phosphoribosylglycinamide formyltransferase [Candidatus Magasanikbacteria bacterium]|nr:phosphoribosylglycinamide formyltransferase [Candidatus Magasanikbacteria bacterium]
MPPLYIGVLGSTRGTCLESIIIAIETGNLNATIEIVVSNKVDAPILERARRHGIEAHFLDPVGQTREEFDAKITRLLQDKKVDLIILIGYMRLLSPSFVARWKNKIMNIHPSLLPAFAGGMDLNVHRAVLASGTKETGCTIHFVDEGVDTGKIIVQNKCSVMDSDTPETLKSRVQALEGAAFIEAIKWFQSKQNANL